jgi:uncharacterized RDD family membrane protein YckC
MSAFDNSTPTLQLSALSNYMGGPAGLVGVGFWPRALARLTDMAAHYGVTYATGMVFGFMLRIASDGHISRLVFLRLRQFSLLNFLLVLLGSILFHALCEGIHGSTPGKLMLSMVVVRDDGAPSGLKAAWIRSLAYVIDSLFFGMVAYSAMQDSPMEQRLGDKWADTVVCKRTELPPASLHGLDRFVVALFFATIVDSALCMLGLLVKIKS